MLAIVGRYFLKNRQYNLCTAGMLLLAQFKGQSVVVVVWLLMFMVLKLLPEDQE